MMQVMEITPDAKGKVRDIYDLGDKLLFVASDRISAFDYILPDLIPYKGEILTRLSLFWFEYLEKTTGIATHFISTDVDNLPEEFAPYTEYLRGRSMIVKKAKMIPIECIVRGYLAGSGWKDYQKTQTICGIELPAGLVESSLLPQTIFTPSTKAELGDHDENISFAQTQQLLGDQLAAEVRDMTVALYEAARTYADERGVIIADTKFELGIVDGDLILADEVLTPDSSRFWPKEGYEAGKSQPSFDKQYVRDWLDAHWDKTGEPPHLPEDVIERTSQKYQHAYELITGTPFVPCKGE